MEDINVTDEDILESKFNLLNMYIMNATLEQNKQKRLKNLKLARLITDQLITSLS